MTSLRPGTHIRIIRGRLQDVPDSGYVWREGLVLTANNYPQPKDRNNYTPGEGLVDNWYVEFSGLDGKGYTYWKQDPDGGQLEVLG